MKCSHFRHCGQKSSRNATEMGAVGVVLHINVLHVAQSNLQIFNTNKDMRKGNVCFGYLALLFS